MARIAFEDSQCHINERKEGMSWNERNQLELKGPRE